MNFVDRFTKKSAEYFRTLPAGASGPDPKRFAANEASCQNAFDGLQEKIRHNGEKGLKLANYEVAGYSNANHFGLTLCQCEALESSTN